MRLKNRLVYILAILITTQLVGTVAPAATLQLLRVFDFPGHPTVLATKPQKVSDQSDIVGTVIQLDGTVQGFLYKIRISRFTPTFSDPTATPTFTKAHGT